MWVLLAVMSAVFTAMFYLINQYYKKPGILIVLLSRILIVIFMMPVWFFVEMPTSPAFYVIVFLSALLGVYGDVKMMDAAARFGGGVVSRLQPFTLIVAFLLWFIFMPSIIYHYLAEPWVALGIMTAIMMAVFFASRMRKIPVNKEAIVMTAPALMAYALAICMNKLAMNEEAMTTAVYGYMFFQSLFAVPLCYSVMLYQKHVVIFDQSLLWRDKKLLLAGGLMFIAWFFHMIFKMYAVGMTVNPSYVATINLIAPLFIILFYKVTGHHEEADVKNGLGILAAAFVLAVLTW
jgi:hypothetical protein